jgi:hypothetical protein
MSEAQNDIDKWIAFSNVSISPWWFREVEQKYIDGKPTRIGPKYTTAIVDKVFYDIDCIDHKGIILQDAIESAIRLWKWLTRNNYRRECTFTTGGYQILFKADLWAECYQSVMKQIRNDLSLLIDPCCELNQMRRYVGSFNFGKESKSKRMKWCIDLDERGPEIPFDECLRLACTKDAQRRIYGTEEYHIDKLLPLQEIRHFKEQTIYTTQSTTTEILAKYGYDYNDLCPCMRRVIEQKEVGHYDRLTIIKYLKDIINIKLGDLKVLLPKLLSAPHGNGTDGSHSIQEGQVDALYARDSHFIPSYMKKHGYCNPQCDEACK